LALQKLPIMALQSSLVPSGSLMQIKQPSGPKDLLTSSGTQNTLAASTLAVVETAAEL
jgi:hypothetical protein